MKYDPERHPRRSIRLKDYDYSRCGAYFVTVCVQERLCLFGDVVNGAMILNDAGKRIDALLGDLCQRFENTTIDSHVVMPNHCHGVIIVNENDRRGEPCVRPELGPIEGEHKVRPYWRKNESIEFFDHGYLHHVVLFRLRQ